MLVLAIGPVRIPASQRQIRRNQPHLASQAQQCDVAQVAEQLRVFTRMQQHQGLHAEFDVDHAAGVVLQVEELGSVGMAGVHFLAHGAHFFDQLRRGAWKSEDVAALGLESGADARVARAVARAGQRLVLPHPGAAALVVGERSQAGDEQAAVAIGPQARVDFEQASGGGLRIDESDQALRQARVNFGSVFIGVVIDEHQVEIRGIAEFFSAKFAVGDDGEFGGVAVRSLEHAPALRECQIQCAVGEFGQVVGKSFDRQHPLHVLREQAENRRMMRFAQRVHLGFEVAAQAYQPGCGLHGEFLHVGLRVEGLLIEQFVEQDRVQGEIARRPLGRREQVCQTRQRGLRLGEQRKIAGARCDGLDEGEQALQREVGHRAGPRGVDQAWQQRVQPNAGGIREPADFRPREGVVDQQGQFVRLREAALRQALRHACFRVCRRRAAKYLFKMPAYVCPLRVERKFEADPVRATHRVRQSQPCFVATRQRMGLQVLRVLQPMLDTAQEIIGRREIGNHLGRQQTGSTQQSQRLHRGAQAQAGVAPGADELLRLRDKLDFADAAGAELDVVRQFAARDFALDLRVQAFQGFDRAEIQVAPVNEGGHDGHQFVRPISGQHTPLDPRVTLPVAALCDQIVLERGEAHCKRAVAPGAQAHVDTKHVAVAGDLRNHGDQAAPEVLEIFLVRDFDGAATGRTLLGVDEDEVDVG